MIRNTTKIIAFVPAFIFFIFSPVMVDTKKLEIQTNTNRISAHYLLTFA